MGTAGRRGLVGQGGGGGECGGKATGKPRQMSGPNEPIYLVMVSSQYNYVSL